MFVLTHRCDESEKQQRHVETTKVILLSANWILVDPLFENNEGLQVQARRFNEGKIATFTYISFVQFFYFERTSQLKKNE